MSIPWSKKEAAIAHKAIAEHKLYKEISIVLEEAGFDRSAEAVRKFYKRNATSKDAEYEAVEPEINDEATDDQYIAIEAIREMRDQLVKITSNKFVKVGRPVEANVKILSLSDLHIPFENPEIIKKMLKDHSDADILVLNGDMFEIYALSKWPKKKNVLLRHEYEIAIEWMKLFTSIFPKIVLVSGNHESRVQSYFTANVDPTASFLVNKDILDRIAKGYSFNDEEGTFEKMYDWDDIVSYEGGLLKYYAIIGNAVFIHPNDFSGVPMRTVLAHCDDLMQCEKFQCMVMGHTHKMGSYIWKNKLVLEQGCCCVPMDYEKNGRARKQSMQTYGAAVVYMDEEGNVDFDKTRNIYYGTGSPIKVSDAMKHLKDLING